MVGDVLREVFDVYGMKATACDTVEFMIKNGLISPKGLRDYQIAKEYKRLKSQDVKRSQQDIFEEISVNPNLGNPSTSTVRDVVQLFCKQ
jgi:hypothetical protein